MQPFCSKMQSSKTKFIFISGGVISGLGKGTTSAALCSLLESCGLKVFPIKVDMYLNIDAGTMNPLEHGETFVTEDGLECDQDIGTYERFLNRSLSRNNYFTAGQVYMSLLTKERQLKFNGACVESYPHLPLEIIEFIHRYPQDTDVVVIEYGGTVGEYQNEAFFEAARMMIACQPKDVCMVHVGYILQPPSLGEMKSKPMQMSIRSLNELGIFPDLLIARSEKPIDKPRLDKLAIAAGLPLEHIISCPDVDNIYEIPLNLFKDNVLHAIFEKLEIPIRRCDLNIWDDKIESINKIKQEVKIGIVAKYYQSGGSNLKDSYISVLEAIRHASWQQGVKPILKWIDSQEIEKDNQVLKQLDDVDGILVPQGWGSRGVEGKIAAIRYAREHKIPYLGLCFGMQMASIEFARNVLGIADANTQEADPDTPNPIIHIMENQKEYIEKKQFGGTIRLGGWPCQIKTKTLMESLYQRYSRLPENNIVSERHRHRYEFNNQYKEELEKAGFIFSGVSPDGQLVEAVELDRKLHPFFIGTQFHPELISRFLDPHPIFLGFVGAMK